MIYIGLYEKGRRTHSRGTPRSIPSEGRSRPAKDTRHPALAIQDSKNIKHALVFLVAGLLDLQKDFGALDGSHDECGGDGGEETCDGKLGGA